jgi:hypothetical protein
MLVRQPALLLDAAPVAGAGSPREPDRSRAQHVLAMIGLDRVLALGRGTMEPGTL